MRVKIYVIAFIAGAFLLGIQSSSAQKGFFTEVSSQTKARMRESKTFENFRKFSVYSLKVESLQNYLLAAPKEGKNRNTNGLQLEIPLPNGTTELFQVFESPTLAPQIAAMHPEIKTYAGNGMQHKGYKIRFSLTPEGFSAIILGVDADPVFFEKVVNTSGKDIYRSYFSSDAIPPKKSRSGKSSSRCGTTLRDLDLKKQMREMTGIKRIAQFSNGNNLKVFRLAMAATGELTTAKGGQAATFSLIASYVNEINAVYESELGVRFSLVSGTNLVYTDAATDPYTANNQETMLGENQANLDNVIGNANYDIGHVLGDGGASSGGGLASSSSACDNDYKAQGASDLGDEADYAHVFNIQVITHEMGHQFSMSHSYNSNIPVCTTRALETSVEPGSGATIMSYGFTCDQDDYSDEYDAQNRRIGPFLNFHVASLTQAINYISTLTCYTTFTTNNIIPVITTPSTTSYTIPKSTPFSLSGEATDGDSDPLTYSWEGTNISDIPNNSDLTPAILGSDTSAPFFRSYPPVNTGTRDYPLLSAILNGSNMAKGDKLPSIPITTTHTLTVRDNNGGVTTEDVTVTIDNSGPFLITNDPTGTHGGATSLPVDWSVNGTTAAPVNCTLVDVLLSTDGGFTFPTVLASAIPNSGNTTVTLPNVNTTQARIKIAPSASTGSGNMPNIFFDISNADFEINSALPVSLLSFDGRIIDGNDVLLTWQTAQEINNAGFDVEMNSNGQEFAKLGHVTGHANSSVTRQYQFPVKDLEEGIYYFRLKSLDINGNFNYSKVVKLVVSSLKQYAFIYPNPANNYFKIYSGQPAEKAFSVRIVDQLGKVVLSLPNQKHDAGFQVNTTGIASGIYHVILRGNDFIETLKLVKL